MISLLSKEPGFVDAGLGCFEDGYGPAPPEGDLIDGESRLASVHREWKFIFLMTVSIQPS
jgi:hypothetical protein